MSRGVTEEVAMLNKQTQTVFYVIVCQEDDIDPLNSESTLRNRVNFYASLYNTEEDSATATIVISKTMTVP